MNPQDENKARTDAFEFLFSASVPSEAAIESMSTEELDEFLKDSGFDLPKLDARIAEQKKKLLGRYALMLAHRRRLEKKEVLETPVTQVPDTREAIIAYFQERFGEEMPFAARNFKAASYEELRLLYLDLGSKRDLGNGK